MRSRFGDGALSRAGVGSPPRWLAPACRRRCPSHSRRALGTPSRFDPPPAGCRCFGAACATPRPETPTRYDFSNEPLHRAPHAGPISSSKGCVLSRPAHVPVLGASRDAVVPNPTASLSAAQPRNLSHLASQPLSFATTQHLSLSHARLSAFQPLASQPLSLSASQLLYCSASQPLSLSGSQALNLLATQALSLSAARH